MYTLKTHLSVIKPSIHMPTQTAHDTNCYRRDAQKRRGFQSDRAHPCPDGIKRSLHKRAWVARTAKHWWYGNIPVCTYEGTIHEIYLWLWVSFIHTTSRRGNILKFNTICLVVVTISPLWTCVQLICTLCTFHWMARYGMNWHNQMLASAANMHTCVNSA